MAKDKEQSAWTQVDLDSLKEHGVIEVDVPETPQDLLEDALEGTSKAAPALAPEVETPEKPATTDEDALKGVDTEGAQKRIRQLVRQKKEREEEVERLRVEVARRDAIIADGRRHVIETEATSADLSEKQLKDKIKSARDAFSSAYEAGDKDRLAQAQQDMADATAELKMVEVRKGYISNRKKEVEAAEKVAPAPASPPRGRPIDNSTAEEWAKKNGEWFGKDRASTLVAIDIDGELQREGFDPTSDEFYTELETRLAEELPHKFGKRKSGSRPVQVVGGQSRTPTSRKVKLTPEDIRQASEWGIPLEKYAAEKLKAESADSSGDYVTIGS